MRKISFVLTFCMIAVYAAYAQSVTSDPISVTTPTSNYLGTTTANTAIQMAQDDATGNVGIGINPADFSCALSISNYKFNSTPNVLFGIANEVNASTLAPGNSQFSMMCVRVDNSPSHNPLALDFVVDNMGLVGIGDIASDGTTGIAHLVLTDHDPSGTIPLMRVFTNASTDAFFIGSNGNVGIGTISPTAPLDVSGSANFRNSVAVTQDVTIGNSLQIGTVTNGGTLNINGVAIGAYGYANLTQVSDPNVKAIAVQQQGATSTSFSDKFIVFADGRTVIGNVPVSSSTASTLATDYMLYVQKGIIAEKYKCALSSDATNWSDYVFDKDYKLASLSEVESYIKNNKHLPGVPSTDEVHCDGIDLAQMDATLLKKIEELTLYVLQLKKDNEALKAQLSTIIK